MECVECDFTWLVYCPRRYSKLCKYSAKNNNTCFSSNNIIDLISVGKLLRLILKAKKSSQPTNRLMHDASQKWFLVEYFANVFFINKKNVEKLKTLKTLNEVFTATMWADVNVRCELMQSHYRRRHNAVKMLLLFLPHDELCMALPLHCVRQDCRLSKADACIRSSAIQIHPRIAQYGNWFDNGCLVDCFLVTFVLLPPKLQGPKGRNLKPEGRKCEAEGKERGCGIGEGHWGSEPLPTS